MQSLRLQKMKKIDTIVIAVGGQGRRITGDLRKRGIRSSKIFLTLNNKPILSHLIDMSIASDFKRFFLLSSYYESELRLYLKKNYPNDKRIVPVYGGKPGKKWGVPWLLNSIKGKLKEPFVYSDGNIVYDIDILRKIKNKGISKTEIANIVLSAKDFAPTHSRVTLNKEKISEINTRLPKFSNNTDNRLIGKKYYSLGLMVLRIQFFSINPRFVYKKDLDVVINDIFKFKGGSVKATIYQGNWIAIHTVQAPFSNQ